MHYLAHKYNRRLAAGIMWRHKHLFLHHMKCAVVKAIERLIP